MILLAIDPGTTESAYVLYCTTENKIIEFLKESNEKLLFRIENILDPDEAVIEKVASYGMPIGESTMQTIFWSGKFAQALSFCPVHRITRKEVVVHLCGTVRAKDSNVRQALIDRFGDPGTKKNPGPTYGIVEDVWAALAVCTAWNDLHPEK